MARIHAFELEDQPWFPALLRQYMTDFLSHMGGWSRLPYVPFTDRLARALAATGDARVVDLCSGGGGPALQITRDLSQRLERSLTVVLTDLYPSAERVAHARRSLPAWVELEVRPVDAQNVPDDLHGFRLVCNGFHHLKPEQAHACLLDAVEKRRGVAVVELANRSPLALLQIVLGTAAVLVVTPFLRPFRWSRLLLTYALPLVPLCTLWDGIISCLRVYDPDELGRLVSGLPPNDYAWEWGQLAISSLPVELTYLIGYPRPTAPSEGPRERDCPRGRG